MSNWQNTLNLKDVWNKADPDYLENDRITMQQLAKIISERLSKIKKGLDSDLLLERDFLVDDFEDLSKYDDATAEDFNDLMENLYDWADTSLDNEWNGRKVCWVATF